MRRSTTRSLMIATALFALVGASLSPGTAAGKSGSSGRGVAYNIGFESFEPTLGATANGDIFFSTTPGQGVAIGWSASTAKSTDGGKTWTDVGPQLAAGRTMPPETNDPYIYVDSATGRVFQFHMSPVLTCSIMSFSDDGGDTWTTNPVGCSPTAVWDHQTMVAAKPRGIETRGYPNVVHQCVNAIYAAMCSRSVDGGLTWSPSVVAYANDHVTEGCGAQHGHLASGPKGHVYLPTSRCGRRPTVYISDDDGGSWRESVIAEMDTPFVDPTVSVDSKGNLYAAFIDEAGWLYYAVSTNNGKSWTKPTQVARGYTANMPVIVAGDPGKVVIAYPATKDLRQGYDTPGYLDGPAAELVSKVSWGANFTVSTNGLAKNPSFTTTVATGKDPIGRGRICGRGTRCAYLIDFIEAIIGPDGLPYASFVDGCLDDCAKSASGPQKAGTGVGLLVTLKGPRLCSSKCWRYKGAPKAATAMDDLMAWAFAHRPEQQEASLRHATLSPELRALQREATRRRLEALGR